MTRFKAFALLALILIIGFTAGCGSKQPKGAAGGKSSIGTADRPITMAMVPSLDTQKLIVSGDKLAVLLEKETGLKYKVVVPTNYTAVMTAMGAGTVDIGWLSPLPYVMAHDRYGVDVVLRTIRDNSNEYWSFIIARTDTGISKLEDLKGKKFAYGDPVSTSGAIYAKHLIRKSGYDPDTFFTSAIYAGAHDRVVMAVYNKQVDAGAIYGGVGTDAREKAVAALPDVMSKTKVIAKSISIPNDTVSVRKGLPREIVEKVTKGLIAVSKSEEGRKTIFDLYGIDGFEAAKDSDYDSVREVAESENIQVEQLDKKK